MEDCGVCGSSNSSPREMHVCVRCRRPTTIKDMLRHWNKPGTLDACPAGWLPEIVRMVLIHCVMDDGGPTAATPLLLVRLLSAAGWEQDGLRVGAEVFHWNTVLTVMRVAAKRDGPREAAFKWMVDVLAERGCEVRFLADAWGFVVVSDGGPAERNLWYGRALYSHASEELSAWLREECLQLGRGAAMAELARTFGW